MTIQSVKQRFGIIGNNKDLNRAIEICIQVAPIDISVLITGESGTGKESLPQIIHQLGHRKHKEYIAINCGAIPEGTIDSELFGHEKGAFTGASESRKGYFEVANGGTIFLDEIAELPLKTQVKLLRVLESGEYIKVGSSKIQKTSVRIIGASHKDLKKEVEKGNFREDLYYRLNTVPVTLPPLRERGEDIVLLFRKFATDFSEKNAMPTIKLENHCNDIIKNYSWPGNIRQLKNVVEQISVIEQTRDITPTILLKYLPHTNNTHLPVLVQKKEEEENINTKQQENVNSESYNELFKMVLEIKKDLLDIKNTLLFSLTKNNTQQPIVEKEIYQERSSFNSPLYLENKSNDAHKENIISKHKEIEENLSIEEKEKELIKKALRKHQGKRKYAAKELGISERTLYRKIKEFDIH
jgi:transcriptional regulator with PAS, ATPase and Fis domain